MKKLLTAVLVIVTLLTGCGQKQSSPDQTVVPDVAPVPVVESTPEPLTSEEAFQKDFAPRFTIMNTVIANVLDNGRTAILCLLNDTSRHRGNYFDEESMHKLVYWEEDTNSFVEIPFWSIWITNYELPRYLDKVLALEDQLGEWNGYFYLNDLNGNGYDELIGFKLTGMSFLPEIWEHHAGSFVQTLEYRDYSNQFASVQILGTGHLKIFGYGDRHGGDEDFPWSEFQWSSDSNRYEIVAQGRADELP